MSPPLVFAYDFEPAEYARAVTALGRWSRRRWIGLVIGLLPVVPIVMVFVTGEEKWISPRFAGGFLIIPVLTYIAFGPITRRLRAMWARRTAPLLQERQIFEFSHIGLKCQAGPASGELLWRGIVRVREDAEFYFFYYSPDCAYYVPKRVIEDESLEDALRSLIRECAPDRGQYLAREGTLQAPGQ